MSLLNPPRKLMFMKPFILSCIVCLGLGVGSPLRAMMVTEVFDFSGTNLSVPGGMATGAADIQSVSSSITSITSVSVDLNVSGGYNGDLYVYLQHGSGLSVLLNRVKQTGTFVGGFDNDGFMITLEDGAAGGDVHLFDSGGGTVSGTFAPDGRSASPATVVDTDPRDSLLDVFNGMDASGTWTLFAADLVFGDSHVVNDWGLSIMGDTAVPEPGTTLPFLALLMTAYCIRRKRGQAA